MPARTSFVHKIILLIGTLILVTAVGLTTVTAYQFRRQLYHHEFQSAHTMYLALVNYLAGHYKSHGERFVRQSLDYVLANKFLRDESAATDSEAINISQILVYNPFGRLVFTFPAAAAEAVAAKLDEAEWPTTYRQRYDANTKSLVVGGPISASGDIPGFVLITMPSDIERQVRALFVRSFSVMGLVLVLSLAAAILFARRALRPIEALTLAAQRVNEGDLNQRVVPRSSDEIGLLATTFNDMTGSLSRRLAMMHRMQEWSLRISREFDLHRLNETLLDMFEDMAPTGVTRLYLHDAKNQCLSLVRYRGTETTISLRGDEVTKRAFERNAPCGLDEKGAVVERPVAVPEMAIPLSTANKTLGVVRLGRRTDHRTYDDEAITTLQTLVQNAAVAIENARLYQELAEKQRFEQEMSWAREIQATLMPQHVPQVDGYEIAGTSQPAYEVGGDYYDYVRANGKAWHLVIGDVSGKGVPAALIMNVVRSLIHSFVEMEEAPTRLLSRVNRLLLPDLEPEMFVTMADLMLDPLTHRVRIVRAGHEPILWLRCNGAAEWLAPPGAALGMLPDQDFAAGLEQGAVQMEPGDLLVLYTDGVTETINRQGEEFGYRGIESILRSHRDLPLSELADVFVREVQSFGGGQAQRDDITLVMLRRGI